MPVAPVPSPSALQKFIPPCYVVLGEILEMFPMICDFVEYQGWTTFFENYKIFYPHLVQEFYGNLHKEDEKLVTSIHGTHINVRPSTIGWALGIPATGVDLDMHVLIDETLMAMTQDEDIQLQLG